MEQELYELLEGINRAGSLLGVYETAMSFIRGALHCNKVAILLIDKTGVMRFVAWQGLSEGYRAAMEGHSPWPVDAIDPQPVFMPNIAKESLDRGMIDRIQAEGIQALGFIPLTYEGKLLGKFMVYFDGAHDFKPNEVRMAQGIAMQMSLAIQRRQASDALRQSEERYRTLVEQIRDYAIFSTDKTGHPVLWNEGVQRILGFSEEEFVGQDVMTLIFTPEDVAAGVPNREFSEAENTGSASNNRWLRRKDGTRFWAEGITTALRDDAGKLIGFSKVFRDSTERKQTENELTSLKDRLTADLSAMTHLQALGARALQPGADLGVLFGDILDAAISIAGANRGNVQLLDPQTGGLRIVAQRGFDSAFLEYFQHVVDETAACATAKQNRRRVIVPDVTQSNLFQNSKALPVLLQAKVRAVQSTPLINRDGKVFGIISTHFDKPHSPNESELRFLDILAQQAADLYARNQAEQSLLETKEQLAASNRDLDRKVQQRTASLNEALQSLETLLYTIAHDLRAPNRAMQGYAHLLINSYAQGLDDEAKFFLQRIADAALKNEALIRDILEYGRLAHSNLPCNTIDPSQNLRAVLQGFDLEIAKKKARIDVAPEWPRIIANDSALSHILTNLISNSLKYTRAGVPPRVSIFPRTIRSEAVMDGSVHLCVQDNGIGVPADQRESIFQPFQRASNANQEGTGMGLAIVRKAAERMGGNAGVDSKLGEGSTFWVELQKAP